MQMDFLQQKFHLILKSVWIFQETFHYLQDDVALVIHLLQQNFQKEQINHNNFLGGLLKIHVYLM